MKKKQFLNEMRNNYKTNQLINLECYSYYCYPNFDISIEINNQII